jgi:transglutaminase-like putative cysteine protease
MNPAGEAPVVLLKIEHTNIYRYARPVEFTTHRLMLRPLESHEVQIRSERLEIQPGHVLRWRHDVFDNSIALVDFTGKASELRISSGYTVQQFNDNPFNFILESYANELPFDYQADEAQDLAPFLRHTAQDTPAIQEWLRPFLDAQGRAATLEFLIALNQSVPAHFAYARREEPGVQTPIETMKSRTGTCRDFALLFMEAARCMGLAARYVSGYVCGMAEGSQVEVAQDATHAWTEIYLPGGGWKGFDPTCGILAAGQHVRVAVTREPWQATPILGNYLGDTSVYRGLEVTVKAHVLPAGATHV